MTVKESHAMLWMALITVLSSLQEEPSAGDESGSMAAATARGTTLIIPVARCAIAHFAATLPSIYPALSCSSTTSVPLSMGQRLTAHRSAPAKCAAQSAFAFERGVPLKRSSPALIVMRRACFFATFTAFCTPGCDALPEALSASTANAAVRNLCFHPRK